MTAAIPVDCKGRKCGSESSLILVPGPTALQKAAITTFPNGVPLPPGTSIDTWWRFKTLNGVVAADGNRIPFITYQFGGQHGMIMAALLKNAAKSWVDQNADVVDYRVFLDAYTGSPSDLSDAATWLALANAIAFAAGYPPNTYSMANITADVAQAALPWWNQHQ